jgi:hypothetical protein
VLTAAAYAPGIHRTLGYDAAETVGRFVLAPTPGDALTGQKAFNNHPLFSFLEHVIVRAAGHSDEWLLRLLPIACAAASVGVLVWAVARALGPLPSLVAGLVTASNPMFVEIGRDVRGYSLMLLVTIVSTVLHLRALRAPTRELRVGYVVAGCIGLLTHLMTAPVLLAHALDVLRRRRSDRSWWLSWAIIAGSALLFYAPRIDDLVATSGSRGRIFRPWFPGQLARELLGHEPVTIVLLGAIVARGLLATRGRAPATTFASVFFGVAALGWMAAPENLAPRFFLWALPGVAVLAAKATSVRPHTAAVAVAAGCTISILGFAPQYARSVNRYSDVATIIDRESATGDDVCVTDLSVAPLLAYTRSFEVVTDPRDLQGCDVVAMAEPGLDSEFVGPARLEFRHRTDLIARDPAIVFSRRPLSWAP